MKNIALLHVFILFLANILVAQDILLRDSLIHKLGTNKNQIEQCKVYIDLGNYYLYYQPDSARYCFETALKKAIETKSNYMKARSLSGLGNYYTYQGFLDSAIQAYHQSLYLTKMLNNDTLSGQYFSNLGITYAYKGIYDSALFYFEKSSSLFEQLELKEKLTKCYSNIGLIYSLTGDFNNALVETFKSVEIDKSLDNKVDLATDYNNISTSYLHLGNYEQALEYSYMALDIREQIKDQLGIAQSYCNIAVLHSNMKNFDKALKYYQKSLQIKIDIKDQKGIGSIYNNIGTLYHETGKLSEAIEFYKKSLEVRLKIDDQEGIGQCYLNIGTALSDKKEFGKALEYLNDAMKIALKINDIESQASILVNKANIQIELGNYDRALENAIKGYHISCNVNNKEMIGNAMLSISNVYKNKKDYKMAYEWHIKYKNMSDSIYTEASRNQMNQLEVKFETEKKQIEIERLNEQNQQKELELERQQAKTRASIIIGILAVLGVITISGLAWFAIKRRRDLLFERQMNHITQLKLTSTRNRVSPHFFFNALGSLKNMADEPEQFQQKLNDLSILMRKTIENIDQVAIPLCEELDIVKAYTELYRHKMDGNLDFQINIEEGIDLNTLIPSMIIQIPVENAIKHGLMQSGRVDKKLYITIKSSEGFILIRITNNGLPLSETIGKSTSTGTGLKTITQSIHLLNANNQQKIYFDLLEWEDKETVTEIKIPKTYNYQLNLN